MNKNPHTGHRARLKERFLNDGFENFAPHEILELLLYYGLPQGDTNPLAHHLLEEFGSLAAVFDAGVTHLKKVKGIQEHTAILLSMIPQLCSVYQVSKFGARPLIQSTADAGEYAMSLLSHQDYEHFYLICLDVNRRVIKAEHICEGTVDSTPAYPRLIVEAALKNKAAFVVMVHNHPGGTLSPSESDKEITNKVIAVLQSMDIGVIDHIIVVGNKFTSFCERGIMEN